MYRPLVTLLALALALCAACSTPDNRRAHAHMAVVAHQTRTAADVAALYMNECENIDSPRRADACKRVRAKLTQIDELQAQLERRLLDKPKPNVGDASPEKDANK